MKPRLESLAHVADAYHYHRFELSGEGFPFFWHYHPEYELTLILAGEGSRLAGDRMEPFGPGDWVLLGPDLPHTWVSEGREGEAHRALVLQFSAAWAERIFPRPEFGAVHDLLARAAPGLRFKAPSPEQEQLMASACRQAGAGGLLALMQLLHLLSALPAQALTQGPLPPRAQGLAQERLRQIASHVQENLASVSLQSAARQVHLSESACCQLFKRHMGRTFSDYVNELRVARASALLVQTHLPVHQVAAEAGFSSLAYFNRVFLRKKGLQPLRFRREHWIGRGG